MIFYIAIFVFCSFFRRWLVASKRYYSAWAAFIMSFGAVGSFLLSLEYFLHPVLSRHGDPIAPSDFFFIHLQVFLLSVWLSIFIEWRARKVFSANDIR
jgi:hypothetical protein